MKAIYALRKARLDKSYPDQFEIFVHYDFNNFFASIEADDKFAKLMGSFTVLVKDAAGGGTEYTVTNDLDLSSATRLKDRTDKLINDPILSKRDRSPDSNKEIQLCGTVHCEWKWTDTL